MEQLRQRVPSVAIVLATANDSVPPVVSLQRGVVEYLVKPFERDRVLAAVRRAVEWHEAARARGPERMTAGDPIDEWINRGAVRNTCAQHRARVKPEVRMSRMNSTAFVSVMSVLRAQP